MMRSLEREIMNGAITLNDALEEQIQLKYKISNFNSSTKPKNQNKKFEKELTLRSINELLKGRQMFLNNFRSGIFLIRNINIDDHYANDHDLDPETTLMPESPAIPLIILDLLPTRSILGKGIKTLPPKNNCYRDCQCYL